MSNSFIEGLYNSAGIEKSPEMSKADGLKLRKTLEGNNKLMGRNKDMFRAAEPRFSTCLSYNPCPICDKCQNKASHLYVKCQLCLIPICTHTYKDRVRMIRRDNFKIIVSKEVFQHIKDECLKRER